MASGNAAADGKAGGRLHRLPRTTSDSGRNQLTAPKPFLKIASYHLSPSKARNLVAVLLKEAGVQRPSGGWAGKPYFTSVANQTVTGTFDDAVQEAGSSGGVGDLQRLTDFNHPVFGGTFSMAVSGANMHIEVEYAGYKGKRLKGPARYYPVEEELVCDILYLRRASVEASSQTDFAETVRYYRSYLFCCLALVDAFVNRFILLARNQGVAGPSFESLCDSRRANERLQLWAGLFAPGSAGSLKKGVSWDHFQKIRSERNRHIHVSEPFFGYRIAELPHGLNYCREGVGGLLSRLLQMGEYPRYSLFERLRTAPMVRYDGPK